MISRVKARVTAINSRIATIKEQNDGRIPRGKNFIATDTDFGVMRNLKRMTDQEFQEYYGTDTEQVLSHLEQTLDAFDVPASKDYKFDYTENVIRQIHMLLETEKVGEYEELLQTVYMTIFQRFNDDIKTEKNFKLTTEFVDKVYRFADEGRHPDVKEIITSEQEVGCIYITQEEYDKLLDIWGREYKNESEKKLAIKFEMVNYILCNIRNRMMHGDFQNKSDLQGNKIVEIFPNDFKGKFFFDCIQEFYEAITKEINDNQNSFQKTKGEKINDSIIFGIKDALVMASPEEREKAIKDLFNNENLQEEGFTSEDIKMTLALPLYVNGFITYNFKQKNSLEQLAKRFRNSGDDKKSEFLDVFYKSKSEDSFTSKVAKFNNSTYLPNQAFEHFRNAIVHNNFVCKNGMIYLRDENPNTGEINSLVIPYDFVNELIEKQYSFVKKKDVTDFPDSPDDGER